MDSATKNLEEDHVHILRLIGIMDKIILLEKPDISDIEDIVDIIRNFADGLHHAKEENVLFPFLAERGFSTTGGPVAVMLHEHVQGREFVRGIEENIILYKSGNISVLNEIFGNMRGYVELLRNHIEKENNILFRMADKIITPADNADLLAGFDESLRNREASGNSVDYIKRIYELAAIYGE